MSQRVRSVVSGDTLVLVNPAIKNNDGIPSTTRLTLAYVGSPRVSSPAGFAAREFLRKLLIAKPVAVTQLYANEGTGASNGNTGANPNDRTYGDVSSPVFRSLVEHVLRHGWAELRSDYLTKPGGKARSEALEAAQLEAQQQQRGIWSSSVDPVSTFTIDYVPPNVYGSNRRIPAIVENVLSGDRIVLRAMLTDKEHFVGVASLAGIRVADERAKKVATELVATRMLQRENVRCMFVAPAPFNEEIPLVTLLHPQGDIALVLATNGWAEVPNVPQIGAERLLLLRNAQQDAQRAGRGIHQAAAQRRAAHEQTYAHKSYEATVIRVLSPDLVQILPSSSTDLLADLVTVQLSSVRGPRRNDVAPPTATASPPNTWVDAAREAARKLLIGQVVRVQTDGETPVVVKQSTEEHAEQRPLVTLAYGPQFGSNAALTLIRQGWATAMRHRRDDLMRSPFYEELLQAEEQAQEKQAGIFQPVPKKSAAQPVYASETAIRARGYLASLERRRNIPAVVDQTLGAGRLRMNVASENCSLMAVLDGVRVPRPTEPYGERALAYVLREWNQREVGITVRAVDKTGAFVTQITQKNADLAKELLAQGLASVHAGAANASGHRAEYDEIEANAQQSKLGMWENYEPEPEVDDATAAVDQLSLDDDEPVLTYRDAVISHVTPDEFYVRFAVENAQHTNLQRDLKQFFTVAQNSAARKFERRPRRRDWVVLEKNYERAIVTGVTKNDGGCFDLSLVDTGAIVERVSIGELLPLPQQYTKLPAMAQLVPLRFVHRPVSLYTRQYVDYLKPLINKPVVVAGKLVYTPDSTSVLDSLNYRMVAKGLVSVPIAELGNEAVQPYLDAQEQIKQARRGMWEYGDPREDEDM